MALSISDRERFALSVGTTVNYINKALSKRKDNWLFGPKLCTQIELRSHKEVTRIDLRPDDWEEIWPELKVTKAA